MIVFIHRGWFLDILCNFFNGEWNKIDGETMLEGLALLFCLMWFVRGQAKKQGGHTFSKSLPIVRKCF